MSETKEPKAKKKSENPLIAAAKAIGTVAGTVASTLGVHEDAAPAAPPKSTAEPAKEKLVKKNKPRLPRKEKKALRKRELASK